MDYIRAELSSPVKTQKNDQVFTLIAPCLGLSTRGRYVVGPLCEEITLDGRYVDLPLHIYRDNKHVMTLPDIGLRAQRRLSETDKGFLWIKDKVNG